MVALVLRLRLTQLSNIGRRRPMQVLGMLLLVGVGVALSVQIASSFGDAGGLGVPAQTVVMVVIGSLITAGYLFVPLLFVADDMNDPRSYAPLGLAPGTVAWGLAVEAFVSIPAVLLTVVAVAQALAWSQRPDAAFVSVVAAILIVITGVLGSRLTRSLGIVFFGGRHLREIAGSLTALAALALTPFVLILGISGVGANLAPDLTGAARILASTPLGYAWAAPADAAAGDPGSAWFKLLLAAAFIALLALLWRALVSWMMHARAAKPTSSTTRRGLGWFEFMPATEVGAVAARSFSYWMRDGRYRFALAVIPVVPVLVVLPYVVVGVWWQNLALIPLPLMCLFLGWFLHNDLAHDNTALWLHVASNTSGWADRLGRSIPVLVVGIPLIAIGAPISTAVYGDWSVFPSLLGVSICVLFSGIGISSYISVRMPYAAVRPGASPFAQPQSSGSSGGQGVAFVLMLVAVAPVLWLAGLGLAEGGDWPLYALLAGIGIGLGVFILGLWRGGVVFDRQSPELLAFSLRN